MAFGTLSMCCPDCGDRKVELIMSAADPYRYRCITCGYEWRAPAVTLKLKPDRRRQSREGT
jgi:uncharacterized Zn finger protein